MKEAVFERLGA